MGEHEPKFHLENVLLIKRLIPLNAVIYCHFCPSRQNDKHFIH